MPTNDQTSKRILAAATKRQPLTSAELVDKLNSKIKNPDEKYSGPRSLSRPLGQLVKAGELTIVGSKSRPKFAKA